jgi:hypothetical protein
VIRRRLAPALAIAVLAAWPGQAAAKGVVTSVKLCGPSGCVTIRDRAVRVALEHAIERGADASPRLAPFVRLTTRPAMFDLRGYLIPDQGIIEINATAHQLGARTSSLLRARLPGVASYRPRITGVWLAGRAVAHPRAYAALLRRPGIAMPASVWNHHLVLIAIALAGQTPWNGWGSALYFPDLRVLHVPDGAWVRVTAAEARMIAADRRQSPPAGGRAAAAWVAAFALITVAGLAAAVATRRRRRPARRPQAV